MTGQNKPRFYSYEAGVARLNRRRDRIVDEVERNRRGEYAVPTWAMGLILAIIVAAIIVFVVLS